MAGSVNKAILIGNLGQDPEIRETHGGKQIANFSVATNERWKDRATGERRERTEWHRVTVFNEGLVRVVEKYVRKGSKVYLEGQIQTRKWTDRNTGQDRFSTEIVLQGFNAQLQMLDSRSSDGYQGGQPEGGYGGQGTRPGGHASEPYGGGQGTADEFGDGDDEVPF